MNFYLKMMLREIETRAPGYEGSLSGSDGNPDRAVWQTDKL